MSANERAVQILEHQIDPTTEVPTTISYPHHEGHEGNLFYIMYSVASLGAMTTPTDMITLTFITSNTKKWGHFQFFAKGTSGWRVRLIEAPTGGAITPTGTKDILNHNRNSGNISTFTDIAGANGKVSYDATLATGGITLWDDYLEGSAGFFGSSNANTGTRNEVILKQNTKYQLSLYGTAATPGTIMIDWYEHTNKG